MNIISKFGFGKPAISELTCDRVLQVSAGPPIFVKRRLRSGLFRFGRVAVSEQTPVLGRGVMSLSDFGRVAEFRQTRLLRKMASPPLPIKTADRGGLCRAGPTVRVSRPFIKPGGAMTRPPGSVGRLRAGHGYLA
jgi:hypothetical protein